MSSNGNGSVRYTSVKDLLVSIIKDVYIKNTKHYSIDDSDRAIVGYRRELGNILKTEITYYFADANMCSDIAVNGQCMRFEIKLMYQDRAVYEEKNVEIFAKMMTAYEGVFNDKDKKKAWAIAFSLQRKIEKEHPELIAIPAWKPGSKLKYTGTVVFVLNKQKLEEIAKDIEEWLKKIRGEEEEEQEETEEEKEELSEEMKMKIAQRILGEEEGEEEEVQEAKAVTTTATTEKEVPQKTQLVKLYILRWVRPSRYLVQSVRIEKTDKGFIEIRDFDDQLRRALASALETIRTEATKKARRYFIHLGSERQAGLWIAVTDEAVKIAEEVADMIRRKLSEMPALAKVRPDYPKLLSKYVVKVIPIYVEPEVALDILNEAKYLLESELKELRERIEKAKAEKKMSYLKRLNEDLEYRRKLYEAVKKMVEELEKTVSQR